MKILWFVKGGKTNFTFNANFRWYQNQNVQSKLGRIIITLIIYQTLYYNNNVDLILIQLDIYLIYHICSWIIAVVSYQCAKIFEKYVMFAEMNFEYRTKCAYITAIVVSLYKCI